jgi:hypothetical protein
MIINLIAILGLALILVLVIIESRFTVGQAVVRVWERKNKDR